MKDYIELQKICMQEVIQAGITPGRITEWKINNRAKTRWGRCTRDCRKRTYSIQIAASLLEDDRISEKDCKAVIIHEILHSCRGCMKHTGLWKEYAERMNGLYGYNIKRTVSGEEMGVENHISQSAPYRYSFVCRKCGAVVLRKRACTFTHYYRNYTCGYCGCRRAFRRTQ